MANPYFEFTRVPTFERDKNRKDCFDVLDMNGVDKNFKIVLASECPVSIEKCLDSEGTLKDWDEETQEGVQILQTLGEEDGLIPLLFSYGVNNEGTIAVNAQSVVYELTDEIKYVKGLFLVSSGNGSGYVLAYSINNVSLEIQDDTLILNVAGICWGTESKGE